MGQIDGWVLYERKNRFDPEIKATYKCYGEDTEAALRGFSEAVRLAKPPEENRKIELYYDWNLVAEVLISEWYSFGVFKKDEEKT